MGLKTFGAMFDYKIKNPTGLNLTGYIYNK